MVSESITYQKEAETSPVYNALANNNNNICDNLTGNDVSNCVDNGLPTQAVKVAVHIRPLIASERLQGCKDCVSVVPGEPQVQIGNFGFTFDHVYGSTALPSSRIFDECVAPLVEGLFHGYNATVLAYGQTGSGKTYTMGTTYTVGDDKNGIIPQVMDLIYDRMRSSKKKINYQVLVSFIEILNEEVNDLLDSNSPTGTRQDSYVGFCTRVSTPPKASIQIRETTNGEITLSGVSEVEVNNLEEMAALLEQGSLCRATASTNMNSQSSRSHAILTITLRQQRKLELNADNETSLLDHIPDDNLCAKLHLVDLAGSERVKRTGADGIRFKEGVHINKGLLALGNVISALGDEKKRKEGGHVPYRDSKLTRLLQDSLGGNSRTVMIACISPADSNAEETLNTLKYANRARNIQNKPIVNRDPMTAEVQRLRQQLELLQSQLSCCRPNGGAVEDTHILKQKIAWLEASNADLQRELQQARDGLQFCAQRVLDVLIERDELRHKLDLLRSGKTWDEVNGNNEYQACCLNDSLELLHAYTTKIQDFETSINTVEDNKCGTDIDTSLICNDGFSGVHTMQPNGDLRHIISRTPEEEEAAAKELEHNRFQVSMDNELQELNERLKQKEAEMKSISNVDNLLLKQQFEKKLLELEEEKKNLQRERDKLLLEVENLACVSDEQTQKIRAEYAEKLKLLESQLAELKRKQDSQAQLLRQKLKSDDAAKRLQEEIQRMKSQKVQLQNKIKQEGDQFRCWKASREKELLQLKKEGRRNEHELLKLQALNQRQKMVLQRKTEEAALATRRLKDFLEARKTSVKENANTGNAGNNGLIKQSQTNQKILQQSIDQELELAVHIHEVRSNYEKQTELRASLAKELEKLRQEQELEQNMLQLSRHKLPEWQARAQLLRSMLDDSSNALVSMASELSEAEERERVFSGRGRWQQLRTIGDAKTLLHYLLNIAIDARCQLREKDSENKELKENVAKLTTMLRQSEAQRIETYRHQYLTQQAIAKAIATSTQVGSEISRVHSIEEISVNVLNFRGIDSSCNDSFAGSARSHYYELRKATHRGIGKQNHTQIGKLVRWKRSHERWLMQFKWRWQKPWRLSEWIRHGDESLTRARPKFVNIAEVR